MSDDLLKRLGETARDRRAEEERLLRDNSELFLPDAPVVAAEVRSLPARPRWRPIAGAAILATAASLLLWNVSTVEGPLPRYELELKSEGLTGVRGSTMSAGPTRLAPGMRVEVVARPQVAVAGRISVRVYLVDGTEWIEAQPEITIDPSGSARIIGVVAENIPVPKVGTRLTVVIGRASEVDRLQPPVISGPKVSVSSLAIGIEN